MTPRISICVPTYNGGKYLRECLDDILSQTFGDFEVVIVDDDSTDDTVDIVNSYAAGDGRIRLYRNSQNLGLVRNWNQCFDLAQGEWIKFVFQDDKVDPRCLEILFQRSRVDVPLTACQRSFIYENITVETQASYERVLTEQSLLSIFPEAGFVSSDHFCRAALGRPGINFIGEPTAVMLHRSVRERFGGFNPEFVQLCDFEYWARIACHVGLIVVPEVLTSFRIHPDSKTAVNNEEREFRTEVVDPLLLKYEFAYGASFAPMRAAARKLRINLQRSLATSAKRVELQVRRRAKDILLPDMGSLAEWKSVVAAYPKLTESLYAVVHKFNRKLDRHLLWRFRNSGVRFKKPGCRCPVILCMDVEPDVLSTGHSQPMAWRGFEIASDLFSTVRPLLASATGAPIHYTWTLRMDQQIAETYGLSSWLVRHYEAKIQQYSLEGDEIGIIARAHRWDETCKDWVADYGNHAWIDDCLRTSFDAFRVALGRTCDSFRFGGGWLSNQAISTLEELKARFDLSLQKGKLPIGPVYSGQRVPGTTPNLSDLPAMPYRPNKQDFTKPDPMRRDGLWIIPLSAAIETEAPVEGATVRYRALNLETGPDEFEWLMNKILSTFDRPYLALTLSSSASAKPRILRNLKMNFSSLLMHPLADRFVFTTPAEASGILGYGD